MVVPAEVDYSGWPRWKYLLIRVGIPMAVIGFCVWQILPDAIGSLYEDCSHFHCDYR